MPHRKAIHDRVLNATSQAELAAAYTEWADHYDSDLLDEMGYVAPAIASDLLQHYLHNKAALILDAGCGTGLVGQVLRHKGYNHLDGLDYSQTMLEKAKDKGVYQALSQGDLTSRLLIANDCYDAVISVGTFTCGHVGPAALSELVRITRPGGYICFTVREQAWEEEDYRATVGALEESGRWQLQEEHTTDYLQQEGSHCKVCLYQVTA